MAYGVSNVVWGTTVVYPSDSLAFVFIFLLFFDVPLYSDVKSSRPMGPRGQTFVLGFSLKEAISY